MTYQKVVSRRSLRLLLKKKPNLYNHTFKQHKRKKTQTFWPRSFHLIGYSVFCISIPFGFSLVLSESNRSREYIINHLSFGDTIVEYTRWLWGEKENIPYPESFSDSFGVVSLRTEVCSKIRQEQKELEKYVRSDVAINIVSDLNDVNGKIIENVPGHFPENNIFIVWSLLCGNRQHLIKKIDRLKMNLCDERIEETAFACPDIYENKIENVGLNNLTNIWSAWNLIPMFYFVYNNSQSCFSLIKKSSYSKKNSDKEIEVKILELEWHVSELVGELCDPNCQKNRDDMEENLAGYKKELKLWKRKRRFSQWIKKILLLK